MILSLICAIIATILYAHFSATPPTLFELYVVMFLVLSSGYQYEQLCELREINGK